MTKHLEMICALRLVIWKAAELQVTLFLLSLWEIKRRKIRTLNKKQVKKKEKNRVKQGRSGGLEHKRKIMKKDQMHH